METLFRNFCAVGAVALLLGSASHAQAADPLVFQVPGNPTCQSFLTNIGDVSEFKIEPADSIFDRPVDGGSITVTVNRVGSTRASLDWVATNVRINCIVVKGGPLGANIYYYGEDGAESDFGLTTPDGSSISHYNVAFGLAGTSTPQVGFIGCINQEQICGALSDEGVDAAVVYIFNPNDPFKQFAFEQDGVVGPSECACNVSLDPCSPDFGDEDACINETTPANAQTVILELQAIEGSLGDPCITIAGDRVCKK